MNNDWGTSQNELESVLVRAATDPAARPAFYKALAESQVLIVPAGEPPPLESGVLKEAATPQLAQIEIQGQLCIPVFTSEARLPQGTRYLGYGVSLENCSANNALHPTGLALRARRQ